jgi:hypothetical protein
MVRRQIQIRMEEGGRSPAQTDVQNGKEHTVALRKACKQSLPGSIMLAACVFFLPWKKNWLRCAAYLGVPAMITLWHARKLYRQFRGQQRHSSLWTKTFAKHRESSSSASRCVASSVLSRGPPRPRANARLGCYRLERKLPGGLYALPLEFCTFPRRTKHALRSDYQSNHSIGSADITETSRRLQKPAYGS